MNKEYIPSNTRLLHGLRSRLTDLTPKIEDKEVLWAFEAFDVVLNELMLRENSQFFVQFYEGLHSALKTGATLLENSGHEVSFSSSLDALPDALNTDMSFSVLTKHINNVLACGEQLVRLAGSIDSPELGVWVKSLVSIERELHAYRTLQAERPEEDAVRRTPPTRDEFQKYLTQRFPERPDINITAFNTLVGGFQKFTVLFDTNDLEQGSQSCVMRAERNERFVKLDAGDVVNEFEMVSLVHKAGVPVAEPLWLEADESLVGRRFFVSRKVSGENYGSALAMDKPLSDKALKSLIAALAKIHQVPLSEEIKSSAVGHWLDYTKMADNTRTTVEAFVRQQYSDSINPSPAFHRIYDWLMANIPEEDLPPCLLHVDYGPHNILMKHDEVAAVLDWESVRIGDPAEDVSYFINIMRNQADPEKTLAYYQEATGLSISEYRLRYFDVFNLMKTLSCCVSTAAMFQTEKNSPIEWCLLALPYSDSVVSLVEEKISLAECAKH